MSKRFFNGATACWLLASIGLTGVIILQIGSDVSLALPVTAAPSSSSFNGDEEHPGGLITGDLETDALDAIVERPLFSSSRRPYEAPQSQTASNPTAPARQLSAKLAGIMLSGESRMALFTHPSKGLVRLRQGQDVDGWRIEEVREHEVKLSNGDKVTLLKLRKGLAKPAKAKAKTAKKTESSAQGDDKSEADKAAEKPAKKE